MLGGLQMTKSDWEKWYDDNYAINELFQTEMHELIRKLTTNEEFQIHSITSRVKKRDSFLKKYESKNYDSIEKFTDVIGVRIITYILEDVYKVCAIIRKYFEIDPDNSGDKSVELKENEMGYLSVHFIARLNLSRRELPENKYYTEKVFEIQIRTLLQHAWAEIEHDNSYKFSGVLPSEIKRRFYLIAGALELMDREFQRLSDDLADYKEKVIQDTKEGHLDIEINSTSLDEYLVEKLKDYDQIVQKSGHPGSKVIQELKDFGITTIRDLDLIITPLMNDLRSFPEANFTRFLRGVMMIKNPEKYFSECWNVNWGRLSKDLNDYIKKYIDIDSFLNKYEIPLY
jgi:ppGpp synthetase/RelA/SpoT-type nucleotidyltranferase